MTPFKKQLVATLLTFTLPLWIVPAIVFVAGYHIYAWIYEEVCGWEL